MISIGVFRGLRKTLPSPQTSQYCKITTRFVNFHYCVCWQVPARWAFPALLPCLCLFLWIPFWVNVIIVTLFLFNTQKLLYFNNNNNNNNNNEQFLYSAKFQLSLKALLKNERVKPGLLNIKITKNTERTLKCRPWKIQVIKKNVSSN